MRKGASDSVLSNCRRFRPQLEQLTDRVVPAALTSFAVAPLATLDTSEAGVTLLAAELSETKAAATDTSVDLEKTLTKAEPELPTEFDAGDEGAPVYMTCMPMADDYAPTDEELLYFTCGFAEEGTPVDEPTDGIILTFGAEEVLDDVPGAEPTDDVVKIPDEGEWLPRETEVVDAELPGDESTPVDETEVPVIYYMTGNPMPPPAPEAAPTAPATPPTGAPNDIVSALAPNLQNALPVQPGANSTNHGSDSPATQVAASTPLNKPSYSFTGTGGSTGHEQDSGSAFHEEGGTQAALPESKAEPEATTAASQQAAPVTVATPATEETASPSEVGAMASPEGTNVDAVKAEVNAAEQQDVLLPNEDTAEHQEVLVPNEDTADQGAALPNAVWGLSAAAAVLTLSLRRQQAGELIGR